ncbi:hypothetical protein AsAng_0031930 [Aureispira anguillae]|uniref:Uncharacterized protein n=1 Tax=Aureispira anguillae TaxID=2864201 RepID=A0A915YG04_9BACT|nr:hypothetical protein AsAng_0031930 [Aureispira anguillae]
MKFKNKFLLNVFRSVLGGHMTDWEQSTPQKAVIFPTEK